MVASKNRSHAYVSIKPSARVEYPAVAICREPAGEISYSVLNAMHMGNIIANKTGCVHS